MTFELGMDLVLEWLGLELGFGLFVELQLGSEPVGQLVSFLGGGQIESRLCGCNGLVESALCGVSGSQCVKNNGVLILC